MRNRIFIFALAAVFSVGVVKGDGLRVTRAVPDTIASEVEGALPAWVAAEVAFAENGDLRADLFSQATNRSVGNYLAAKQVRRGVAPNATDAGDCSSFLGRPLEQFASTASAGDLVENSRNIFAGVVTDTRQGFLFGSPGTLVAVHVDDWLKRERASDGPVFLFHPYARIGTPHGTICARPVAAAPVPSLGDRMMIFAYTRPVGASTAIFRVEPARQMVLRGRAAEHIPDAIRSEMGKTAGSDLGDIARFVRAHPRLSLKSREPELR